jgi:membrane associated rhomboid family serine protease
MGIYDRDYYRREGPSFLGSFTGRGQVCKWLILINAGVFVLQLLSPGHRGGGGLLMDALSLDPQRVWDGQIWRLLTYAFLHDPQSIFHIVFNMLFLWWFGHDMEEMYGSKEFLGFYLVAAVLGGVAFQLAWALSWIPHVGGHVQCIGASGAVTAVMVLYALHFPTRVIYLWFFFPIPIWVFVGFQVFMDSFQFLSRVDTGTAVTVHLGGAAFGLGYYKSQVRLLSFWSSLRSWQRKRSRPPLRVYREEPVAAPARGPAPRTREVDETMEARVDAVLEKVARSGQASLTEDERQILLRASEVYKRRRT